MAQKYCNLCKHNVGTSRQIGVGTFIMILVTAGFWIFAIPFYGQRCNICRAKNFGKFRTDL